MKFATYNNDDGTVLAGVVSGYDTQLRLHPLPTGTTVLDLVRSGLPAALAQGQAAIAGAGVPIEKVQLLAPLQPPTVRDFVAFEEHVEGVTISIDGAGGVAAEWYQAPRFYFTNPYSIVGPGEAVAGPAGSTLLDFELEVAAVVGRDGRNLDPDTAAEHIFGYTIMNDFSARDLQRNEMKVNLGPAKGKDFATALGPWLVTADEFTGQVDADGHLELEMSVTVNGTLVGSDLSSNMGWPFGDLVAYASRDSWVRAGDVLGSGTCGNGGCLAELWGRRGELLPPPLAAGDVVEMTVEGIGTLRNTILAASDPVTVVRPARTATRRRHRELAG